MIPLTKDNAIVGMVDRVAGTSALLAGAPFCVLAREFTKSINLLSAMVKRMPVG